MPKKYKVKYLNTPDISERRGTNVSTPKWQYLLKKCSQAVEKVIDDDIAYFKNLE